MELWCGCHVVFGPSSFGVIWPIPALVSLQNYCGQCQLWPIFNISAIIKVITILIAIEIMIVIVMGMLGRAQKG